MLTRPNLKWAWLTVHDKIYNKERRRRMIDDSRVTRAMEERETAFLIGLNCSLLGRNRTPLVLRSEIERERREQNYIKKCPSLCLFKLV
jgi:hypothetical protein